MNKPIRFIAGLLLPLMIAALACSAPSAKPTLTPAPTTPPATATPIVTPTIAPTPTIPAGWEEYHDDTLQLTLAKPSGWEVTPVDEQTLEVHQTDGDGWLQIVVLSGTVSNPFALAYTPGMTGDSVEAALLVPAKQDGGFPDAQPIATRSEQPAWVSEGHSDVYNEQTLIAAVGLPNRSLVFVGHGGAKAEDWPKLSEIYRGIVASLQAN